MTEAVTVKQYQGRLDYLGVDEEVPELVLPEAAKHAPQTTGTSEYIGISKPF